MAKLGIAGYPVWNDDETQLLGIIATITGPNFSAINTSHEIVGEHWDQQLAANLLEA